MGTEELYIDVAGGLHRRRGAKLMPIRPENRSRYPATWKETSRRLRFERADGRCECSGQCGLHLGRRCVERHGEPAVYARGKIVLTVAHLDHQPENCADENLLVACPRCHNRIDVESRRAGIRERRRQESGQARLELEP